MKSILRSNLLITTITVMLLAVGCSSFTEMEGTEILNLYDFSKYSKEGFLFTPYSYAGEYESIGIYEYEFTPDIKLYSSISDKQDFANYVSAPSKIAKIKTEEGTKYYLREQVNFKYVYVGILDINDVIEKVYNEAKAHGADAFANVVVEREPRTHSGVPYVVTIFKGFAIKRK
ncbi:MAG: hypothetical protein K9J12_12425 [Melioribacteraceae bacterium]|nr:hypothetical protein [Melioribacteraceae bacterium]MCF8265845.1 hypothetical protein [Melioribacteraceae bacterium]MCF8414541.1 hypothetical protein [Melioribacteraceae bacterium]